MEQVCPRCKTSSYQNPSMKLMVNTCGHRLCESCVDAVFLRPSAPCPECGIPLRRNQFRRQQFECSTVEKEVDIRKKILKDYNKTQDDFPSLRSYNDYLEVVETIIYNLTYGVDVEDTKEKVEQYRKENQSLILKNRVRLQREEQAVRDELERERRESELRSQQSLAEIAEVERERKRLKTSVLDQLASSDSSASEVLARCAAAITPVSQEPSKGPTYHAQKSQIVFNPVPRGLQVDDVAYTYQPLVFDSHGPPVPDSAELQATGYLTHMGQADDDWYKGGGFCPVTACQRQLQDAFSCLLYFPPH